MSSVMEDGKDTLATQEQLLESARVQVADAKLNPEYGIPDCDNSAASLAVAQSYQQHDMDLGSKQISDLPEELIDIIKTDVTRLNLGRNHLTGLSGLSSRIHECTNLKYLVLKRNKIKEFPRPILTLTGLEFLDLMDNRIEAIPEDLSKLASLKICSLSKNRIKKIPLCVVQMRTLQTLDVYRNPIEFPPRKEWSIEPNDEDDRNSVRSDVQTDRQRRAEETQLILKFLREEILRRKTHKEGTDGEQRYEKSRAPRGPADPGSESNVETPRPARRKASGRPPIRPSVSVITVETLSSSRPASPLPPRPLLAKPYTALQSQPLSAAIRPGVAPLINNNNERNRSNSESVMAPTTRRDKRKGFFNRDQQLSRELILEQDPNSLQTRSSHFKGLSYSGVPNGDSSDQATPVEGEPTRPSFVQRLSSLPEGKRKSRVDNPFNEFARGISYSLQQVAKPLEIVLIGSSPKGPMGRTWTNAYQFLEELHKQIAHAERQGEHDEDYDRHKSESLIHKSCSNCVQAFIQLCMTLQGHVRSIAGQSDLKHVRTLMHMLYASLVEVQNACKRLGGPELKVVDAVQNRSASYHRTSRVLSPGSDRPVTSMRHRDQMRHKPRSSTSSYGFSQYNQFSMPSASRSGSTASFTPTTPYSIDSFTSQLRSTAPTTRSNSNAITRGEYRMDDFEERQFEQILIKLEITCDMALQDLPPCNQILFASRMAASDRRGGDHEASSYVTAYECGRAFIELAETLRSRVRTVKINERQSRDQLDFWQLCNEFTRDCVLFAGHIKDICLARMGPEGDDLKARLRPLFRSVKQVSRYITESPWHNLAVPSGQQPTAPLPVPQTSFSSSNGDARNTPSRNHAYSHSYTTEPSLSLQTRGQVPPAPTSDPQSAVSNASSGGTIGSGHVTPLPATPMSAALGHAALATVPGHSVPVHVPAITDLSEAVNAAYNASNGGGKPTTPAVLERARSVSQRRM